MKKVYLIINVSVGSFFPFAVFSSRKAAQIYAEEYYVQKIGYDSSSLRVSEYNLLGEDFVNCMLEDAPLD